MLKEVNVKKFLIYAGTVAVLVFFSLIMLSGNILKKPLGSDDDIPGAIENMLEAVENGAWNDASEEIGSLESAWNKVLKRIQFGSERDEINQLSKSIARLKGALEARDKSGSLMELHEAYMHWENLGK